MDNNIDSPTWRRSGSDKEVSGLYMYSTVSSAPAKRKAGRNKFRETRHPIYKGVRQRNADKWVCEVREPNKKSRIWLGTFPTAEMAARAHDVAAMALRGRFACLNFADSAWLLPVPNSSSPKDIQKTAAEAAERFKPMEIGSHDVGLRHHNSPMETETLEEEVKNKMTNWYDYGMEKDGCTPTLAEEGWFSLPPSPTMHQHLCGSDEGCNNYWDDIETSTDISLWSFSI